MELRRRAAAARKAVTQFGVKHWLPLCFLVATVIALTAPAPGRAVVSVTVMPGLAAPPPVLPLPRGSRPHRRLRSGITLTMFAGFGQHSSCSDHKYYHRLPHLRVGVANRRHQAGAVLLARHCVRLCGDPRADTLPRLCLAGVASDAARVCLRPHHLCRRPDHPGRGRGAGARLRRQRGAGAAPAGGHQRAGHRHHAALAQGAAVKRGWLPCGGGCAVAVHQAAGHGAGARGRRQGAPSRCLGLPPRLHDVSLMHGHPLGCRCLRNARRRPASSSARWGAGPPGTSSRWAC